MASGENKIDQKVGLSYGPGAFSAAEFLEAAKEVVNPDLSGYEFFVESHGTKIYRHFREVSRNCLHEDPLLHE